MWTVVVALCVEMLLKVAILVATSFALKCRKSDYFKNTNVVDLCASEFVDRGTWVVLFYASWCSHCPPMKKRLVSAARANKSHAKFGAIDCDTDENELICYKNGISGYPTVKVFENSYPVPGLTGDSALNYPEYLPRKMGTSDRVEKAPSVQVHKRKDSVNSSRRIPTYVPPVAAERAISMKPEKKIKAAERDAIIKHEQKINGAERAVSIKPERKANTICHVPKTNASEWVIKNLSGKTGIDLCRKELLRLGLSEGENAWDYLKASIILASVTDTKLDIDSSFSDHIRMNAFLDGTDQSGKCSKEILWYSAPLWKLTTVAPNLKTNVALQSLVEQHSEIHKKCRK